MDEDLTARHRSGPLDDASRERLAASGLELRRIDSADKPGFGRWLDAVARGFLDDERTDEQRETASERLAQRRAVGVYDPGAPEPDVPVATFASWVAELAVPGGRGIPSAAISSVTVAPTHRRRGIARAMMENELRRSAADGVPIASLTVSESTLYGRYGFAPAAPSATWRIDVKRAGWIGPAASGRVDFVSRERLRDILPALHDAARLRTPGEFEMPHGHWDRFLRTQPGTDKPGHVRAVQYADAGGTIRGAAVYTVQENEEDFTKSELTLVLLLAADDDAYAGLWRFFLEMDLIGTLTASELSTDEPLLWMIRDQRAAVVTVRDHHYLRILDVPASLEARAYGAPGTLLLDVDDPLRIGGGRFLLQVGGDGTARVAREPDHVPDSVVSVRLGIAELSAAYLGGVSLATLAAAGRVSSSDAEAAARMFGWHVAPRLSYWY